MSHPILTQTAEQYQLADGRMATLRELGSGDFARVRALRNDVIASLSDPDLYVREKDESAFVMSHLGERGITLGIELGNNLIGYSALTLDIERAALEPELALAIREDASAANGSIDRCGLLAVTMIRPPFQGGALHNAAIASRVRIAREHGKRTLVAMAPPANAPSLRNLTRWGFRVDDVLDFEDGRIRFLLHTPIVPEVDVQRDATSHTLPLTQIDTHRSLLAEGFVGHEVFIEGDQSFLRFSRRLRSE